VKTFGTTKITGYRFLQPFTVQCTNASSTVMQQVQFCWGEWISQPKAKRWTWSQIKGYSLKCFWIWVIVS